MRIAIVGAGAAGLVAAYRLGRDHEVLLFEQQPRAGGHAHTVTVETPGGPLALDIGFLVYNERTYPLFSALLRELDVETVASAMSFSVTCARCRLQYSGTPRGLFAQRRRLFDVRHWRLLTDIVRFNRWTRRDGRDVAQLDVSLETALRAAGCSRALASHYLLPMTSAIWSASTHDTRAFPWAAWLAFFENHGLLQVTGQPPWRSIAGGSRRYLDALLRRLGPSVHLDTPVHAIARRPHGIQLSTAKGEVVTDAVVLAVHADEAARLLRDADAATRQALEAIAYTTNEVVLHTDRARLPSRRAAWAAWNYHMTTCKDEHARPQVTYWLNTLQQLDTPAPYCVTLNPHPPIAPAHVIARQTFAHPVYGWRGDEARQRIRALSGQQRTWFCGAYLGYGFHEDAVRSATDVADAIRMRSAA
jgi:uncharacterized protein